MNKNILMTEHERTLNEISLEGIKWREDRIVRLEEALRDLLDGDGDMTAARIAKARAALGSSSETPAALNKCVHGCKRGHCSVCGAWPSEAKTKGDDK